MAQQDIAAKARSRGEAAVDLDHLARQTMGDRELAREVLDLFAQQLAELPDAMRGADDAGRRRLAHTIKGSARGIGAFALADCASLIENSPSDTTLIARLSTLADEAGTFIASRPL